MIVVAEKQIYLYIALYVDSPHGVKCLFVVYFVFEIQHFFRICEILIPGFVIFIFSPCEQLIHVTAIISLKVFVGGPICI